MATIQLRRKLTGVPAAAPATANPGEPYYSTVGFLGGGPEALYIDNGTTVVPLVDNTRQVEIAGAQTITGAKTIATGVKFTLGVDAALPLEAVTFQQLQASALVEPVGAGTWSRLANSTWQRGVALSGDTMTGLLLLSGDAVAPTGAVTLQQLQAATPTIVTDGVTISGTGLAASPIALIPTIFSTGLVWTPNTLTVAFATDLQIAAGTNAATSITPAGLRSQLGADAATIINPLPKTVVPAINQLYTLVEQLVGVVIFAGSYDATTNQGTFNGQGGIPAGTTALPAASAANHGAYVIVTVAGTGVAPAPVRPLGIGDWLLCDGTAWLHLAFSQQPLTAANVGFIPTAPMTATNVQGAIDELLGIAQTPGVYEAPTFTGTAVAGDPLVLAVVDGGTF